MGCSVFSTLSIFLFSFPLRSLVLSFATLFDVVFLLKVANFILLDVESVELFEKVLYS